jgi:hypothetical protein
MTMQTDVKATWCNAGGTTLVFEGRTRFKGVTISAGNAGNVAVNNGTTNIWFFSPVTGAGGTVSVVLPGEGIIAAGNLTVTCGNATATVIYG